MEPDRITSPDRTAVDISLLIVRVVAGIIFAAHGAQLLFGAWNGPGLNNAVQMLGVGLLGYLVVVGQFFGGLGLIFGVLSRFSAAALIIIMIGAIVKVHLPNGFFLSFVDPRKNGFEYNLALIGLLLPVLICGPGRFSIAGCFLPKSARTGHPTAVIE